MTATELGPPQGGRGIQLTDDLQQRILVVIKGGSYIKVAAQYVGVGESTLRSWLTRGRKAAVLRDRHDPEGLYCPRCDHDRTLEVRQLHAEQQRLDAEYERARDAWLQEMQGLLDDVVRPAAPDSVGVVLGDCPECGSTDAPQPFELPENDARCLSFLEAVTRAEVDAEVFAATAWRSKFTEDWRAARDYLVRRHPERWAATTRVQISSEEAEQRISRAVDTALTALGVDFEHEENGDTRELLASLDLDRDTDHEEEGDDGQGEG